MIGILALEDGTILKGTAIGATGITCGEIVFNTAFTGYQEILTDPSYAGQIINFTNPHIGNTGMNLEDEESSSVWIKGIIVRNPPTNASNWRSTRNLIDYMNQRNVIGITEIDTRFITQKLRDQGVMLGCIMTHKTNASSALEQLKKFKENSNKNVIAQVSTKLPYTWPETQKYNTSLNNNLLDKDPFKIIVFDFGIKRSILKTLEQLGCEIIVVPWNFKASDALKFSPEGIVLSNGPGDPTSSQMLIKKIRTLIKTSIPIFGICLGYQLLAIAEGAKCIKMKFGHHGCNHPVQNLENGKVLITSQNHGFAILEESLPPYLYATHRSLFDGSLQGFHHKSKSLYGFQGHPEAGPGPLEAISLFQPFISDMKHNRQLLYTDKINDKAYRY